LYNSSVSAKVTTHRQRETWRCSVTFAKCAC